MSTSFRFPVAPLSFEGRCKAFLEEHGMTISSFHEIALALHGSVGVGRSRFADALAGKNLALPGDVTEKMENTMARLKFFVVSVAPFILDLNRPNLIAAQIIAVEERRLRVEFSETQVLA